jgi:hypothetical protein
MMILFGIWAELRMVADYGRRRSVAPNCPRHQNKELSSKGSIFKKSVYLQHIGERLRKAYIHIRNCQPTLTTGIIIPLIMWRHWSGYYHIFCREFFWIVAFFIGWFLNGIRVLLFYFNFLLWLCYYRTIWI